MSSEIYVEVSTPVAPTIIYIAITIPVSAVASLAASAAISSTTFAATSS
jgi:hypothetical protein